MDFYNCSFTSFFKIYSFEPIKQTAKSIGWWVGVGGGKWWESHKRAKPFVKTKIEIDTSIGVKCEWGKREANKLIGKYYR